jgi:tetratricopeptide (TPR) repeat protein
MRRFLVLAVVAVAGCMSTWERHQTQLAAAEAHGDYIEAVSEQRWLIDNAFLFGPRSEHNFEADARRYRHLAKLAAKTGNYRLAVEALKQALNTDPSQAAAVRRQLDALPLSPSERAKVNSEFSWNIAALRPGDDSGSATEDEGRCWSYRILEVRVTHQRTVSTPGGMQRQVTYDARTWAFDSDAQRWRAADQWITDAGTETEWVNGPSQPRYQALIAANGRFFTDGKVPPCHRDAWQGPYDAESGTIFIAAQLPVAAPAASH